IMGSRRKARECALQMLFAADVAATRPDELARSFWSELADGELDKDAQEFATRLALGTLEHLDEVDERIKSRAEHWRIDRMATVDRNVLRLAVYEFLHEPTPRTVAINEALEVARRFSTYEATQFINGILDAIKRDLDRENPESANGHNESGDQATPTPPEKSQSGENPA
ncbi:MAG TPA: transcription antitermination factor NusB, partial [Pyrinomonadaceae bacterium]